MSTAAKLAANKKLVLAFYEQIIGRKDFDGALKYMGATYTQHAPYAADGHPGLRAWLAGFKAAFPDHRYEVKRVLAEGDYVMLHLHGMGGPNPHGESVVDIFRVQDGKVVEHWDIIQPIPDKRRQRQLDVLSPALAARRDLGREQGWRGAAPGATRRLHASTHA